MAAWTGNGDTLERWQCLLGRGGHPRVKYTEFARGDENICRFVFRGRGRGLSRQGLKKTPGVEMRILYL